MGQRAEQRRQQQQHASSSTAKSRKDYNVKHPRVKQTNRSISKHIVGTNKQIFKVTNELRGACVSNDYPREKEESVREGSLGPPSQFIFIIRYLDQCCWLRYLLSPRQY